jgi:hypothetical protein
MTRTLAVLVALIGGVGSALAQSAPLEFFSTTGTNSTLVFSGNSLLKSFIIGNTTTTLYFVKFYNKATAPTCGTDTPKWTLPVTPGAASSSASIGLTAGDLIFPLGLGFCITGGLAPNDTTGAAAGVVVNLGVSGK